MNLNLTKQQAFDQMVTHMRTQQAISTGQAGWCVYRNPNGLKCAVGALIPDDLPIEDLDTLFLERAQYQLHDQFHDRGFDLNRFEQAAQKFAVKESLICPTN